MNRPRRSWISIPLVRVLSASALAWFCAAPSNADIVSYNLVNNGGLTDNGNPVSVSGNFTYDTVTQAIPSLDITLINPVGLGGARRSIVRLLSIPTLF